MHLTGHMQRLHVHPSPLLAVSRGGPQHPPGFPCRVLGALPAPLSAFGPQETWSAVFKILPSRTMQVEMIVDAEKMHTWLHLHPPSLRALQAGSAAPAAQETLCQTNRFKSRKLQPRVRAHFWDHPLGFCTSSTDGITFTLYQHK